MANEITLSLRLAVTKGGVDDSDAANQSVTMAGEDIVKETVNIPTTAGGTALSLGNLTNAGYAYFKNLDVTNFVQIGVQVGGTFYPLLRLNAGEPAVFRLAQGVTPYALANTAACRLYYKVIED